jgi:hypothetical protein
MPLMRYFLYVGGALFALLFIVTAFLPSLPGPTSSQPTVDRSIIRIHSDAKWPEAVVFDTTRPTITPAPAVAAIAAPLPPQKSAADVSQERVREAYAQVPTTPSRVEPKRKRKAVARNYGGPPRMMVAQQPPAFFFGRSYW